MATALSFHRIVAAAPMSTGAAIATYGTKT